MHCSTGETKPGQVIYTVFFLLLSVFLEWLLFRNTYNEENSDELPKNTCHHFDLGNFPVMLSDYLISQKTTRATRFNPSTAFLAVAARLNLGLVCSSVPL